MRLSRERLRIRCARERPARRGGSFLQLGGAAVYTLVCVGHLGPAGVDGGRVPITQHSGAPTFVSPPPLSTSTRRLSPRFAFAPHRGCNTVSERRRRRRRDDDNWPVGGQTIVYLRARRSDEVSLILRYISPPQSPREYISAIYTNTAHKT